MAITTDVLSPNKFDKSITGAADGFVWTASDTGYFFRTYNSVEKQMISKGISVSEAGVYAFTMASGNNLVVYLAAGIIHPIHAKQYLSTDTTGTGDLTVWI